MYGKQPTDTTHPLVFKQGKMVPYRQRRPDRLPLSRRSRRRSPVRADRGRVQEALPQQLIGQSEAPAAADPALPPRGGRMNLVQVLINGLITSGELGIIAIGLTMTFSVLRFANFAHTETAVVGAYLALLLNVTLGLNSGARRWRWRRSSPASSASASISAVFRVFRDKGDVAPMIASLGIAIAIRNLIQAIWGPQFLSYDYDDRARHQPVRRLHHLAAARHPGDVPVAMLAFHAMLQYTPLGKAMRATATNPRAGAGERHRHRPGHPLRLVHRQRLRRARRRAARLGHPARPELGFVIVIPVFACVLIGGVGSIYGAILGALVVGIAPEFHRRARLQRLARRARRRRRRSGAVPSGLQARRRLCRGHPAAAAAPDRPDAAERREADARSSSASSIPGRPRPRSPSSWRSASNIQFGNAGLVNFGQVVFLASAPMQRRIAFDAGRHPALCLLIAAAVLRRCRPADVASPCATCRAPIGASCRSCTAELVRLVINNERWIADGANGLSLVRRVGYVQPLVIVGMALAASAARAADRPLALRPHAPADPRGRSPAAGARQGRPPVQDAGDGDRRHHRRRRRLPLRLPQRLYQPATTASRSRPSSSGRWSWSAAAATSAGIVLGTIVVQTLYVGTPLPDRPRRHRGRHAGGAAARR